MRYKYLLFLIFILVFVVRLLVTYNTPSFSYDTYDLFRQVDSILDNGFPLFYDELSHGGRERVFSPLYGYLLAFFSLFFSTEFVFNVIPNFLGSLTVLIVFYLIYQITNRESASLIFAGLSGFIPVFFLGTVNNASVLNLVVPLFLITIHYFLLSNKDPKHVYKLIFSIILLTLLHPISIVLSIGLIIYLLFLRVKNFRESNRESEIVLFFSFLVFWLNMIVYKRALLSHNNPFIWKNIPTNLLNTSYGNISFLEAVYGIGSVILILGVLGIYFNLFDSKRKSVTLFMSLTIVFASLVFLRILDIFTGLIFLGVVLCILSAYAYVNIIDFINNFKYKFTSFLFIFFIIFIQIGLFLPSLNASIQNINSPSVLDIEAAKFMSDFEEVKILTQYNEGHFFSYYSNQKTVIDSDFLLVGNIDKFYDDASGVYRDRFLTDALSKLTRLKVTHIFLSENYQIRSNKTGLLYYDDNCIRLIYPEDKSYVYHPKIYEVRCLLNE